MIDNNVGLTVGRLKGVVIGTITIAVDMTDEEAVVFARAVALTVLTDGVLSACAVKLALIGPTVVALIVIWLTGICDVCTEFTPPALHVGTPTEEMN